MNALRRVAYACGSGVPLRRRVATNPVAVMTVTFGGTEPSRLGVELFHDLAPVAVGDLVRIMKGGDGSVWDYRHGLGRFQSVVDMRLPLAFHFRPTPFSKGVETATDVPLQFGALCFDKAAKDIELSVLPVDMPEDAERAGSHVVVGQVVDGWATLKRIHNTARSITPQRMDVETVTFGAWTIPNQSRTSFVPRASHYGRSPEAMGAEARRRAAPGYGADDADLGSTHPLYWDDVLQKGGQRTPHPEDRRQELRRRGK